MGIVTTTPTNLLHLNTISIDAENYVL